MMCNGAGSLNFLVALFLSVEVVPCSVFGKQTLSQWFLQPFHCVLFFRGWYLTRACHHIWFVFFFFVCQSSDWQGTSDGCGWFFFGFLREKVEGQCFCDFPPVFSSLLMEMILVIGIILYWWQVTSLSVQQGCMRQFYNFIHAARSEPVLICF